MSEKEQIKPFNTPISLHAPVVYFALTGPTTTVRPATKSKTKTTVYYTSLRHIRAVVTTINVGWDSATSARKDMKLPQELHAAVLNLQYPTWLPIQRGVGVRFFNEEVIHDTYFILELFGKLVQRSYYIGTHIFLEVIRPSGKRAADTNTHHTNINLCYNSVEQSNLFLRKETVFQKLTFTII
ncbi:hypothetical protein QTP88_026512 [Uroleucon formosanum]